MIYDVYKKIFIFIMLVLLLCSSMTQASNMENGKQTSDDTSKDISSNIVCQMGPVGENDNSSIYQLLVIAPSRFKKALQPLILHKNRMGVSSRLVTLDEVYDQMYWKGRDDAEKIKYFIKTAVEEWGVKYVLLVGGMKGQWGKWYVPVRYVHMDDGWEDKFITDLYYADIYDSNGNFSTWDSDNDGIFGEWYEDKAEDEGIDLYPDVCVGRLPCRNVFEVKIVVKKIIDYETKTFGKDWFGDMLVVAGDTYPESQNPNWTGYEGEYYAERALENMTGFNPVRLYASDGSFSKQSDVIKALSKGCGFVYFVGHGNPTTWGNHPPNSTSFITGLKVWSMYRLRNHGRFPVCVVSGCHNCQFDVSILRFFNKTGRYRGEATPECWGWWLTRKIGGGAIATIGCTALGYTKEDKISFDGGLNWLEVEFFRSYGQKHIHVLGETWAEAVSSYIDTFPIDWNSSAKNDSFIDAKVVESWNIIGDPSLMIGGYPQDINS
ncbi:MAG: hypothetical protein DRN05_01900 [Thermoplasmata archaeon]|nr:MAG: hypothetical protein DRN05_01900 [Thermoplasmata archaeon]